MLKYTFLTDQFYSDHAQYHEIEKKTDRPYVRIQIFIDGIWWAIPLRSNIRHSNVIWTDKKNGCGIDLSKAVVVIKPDEYLDRTRRPHIRGNEHDVIKRLDDHFVVEKFKTYIESYKKAKTNLKIQRNYDLVRFSTLQYFEQYI